MTPRKSVPGTANGVAADRCSVSQYHLVAASRFGTEMPTWSKRTLCSFGCSAGLSSASSCGLSADAHMPEAVTFWSVSGLGVVAGIYYQHATVSVDTASLIHDLLSSWRRFCRHSSIPAVPTMGHIAQLAF